MAGEKPWMKFYTQDWRADEKLRNCSIGARGLWIEMLCIMHRSERYGLLLVNGSAPSIEQLSRQVAASPNEVAALLNELQEMGVFSTNTDGVIYSRRMKKDEKKSQKNRKNGLKGGNPRLRTNSSIHLENSGSLNRDSTERLSEGLKPQRPEARVQSNRIEHFTEDEYNLNLSDSELGTESENNPQPQNPTRSSTASPREKNYAFEGEVIRLNRADYDKWKKRFHAIPDIDAELWVLDDFYANEDEEHGERWFHRVPKALIKKHNDWLTRPKQQVERSMWDDPLHI